MIFPTKVGGFARMTILRYDSKSLDVSAGYVLEEKDSAIHAMVSVYPATASVTAAERGDFNQRKSELLASHPGAHWQSDREYSLVQEGKKHPGRLATLEFERGEKGATEKFFSRLYFFVEDGKWVIQYRVTYPKSFRVGKKIQEFLQTLEWPSH